MNSSFLRGLTLVILVIAGLPGTLFMGTACTRGRGGRRGDRSTYAPTCLQGGGGTTLQALIDAPPRSTPARVKVVAWFRGRADCGVCPPDALCQPCISKLMFSDRADSPDEEWFYLSEHLRKKPLFREGCAYRLTLTLERDYEKVLAVRDNNPLYYGNLNLFAVLIEDIE